MREPENLAEQLNVLLMYDKRYYVVTHDQAAKILAARREDAQGTVSIGNEVVFLNQISGMPTLATYRRQMKTTLAEKGQRMCQRCGSIVPMADKCACRNRDVPPEQRPLPLLAQASKENPVLKKWLEDQGLKELASPTPVALLESPPDAPQTEEERQRQLHYEQQRTAFLRGHAMPQGEPIKPIEGCADCQGTGQMVLSGSKVTCVCITNRMTWGERKALQK